MNPLPERKLGFYEKYIKRILDIVCAMSAFVFFGWLYIVIAILVRIKLGTPVIFKQARPGMIDETGQEKIFVMYKFRTMKEMHDKKGNMLPDEKRLTEFGRILRTTSLDELPEAYNIIKGDMSIIGPRPQLVQDMVFMSDRQRMRHTARPGLSGLAQVNGRNAITWGKKLELDLDYVKKVTFINDMRLVLKTAKKFFVRGKNPDAGKETDLTFDYGDALLFSGEISREMYEDKQKMAKEIINAISLDRV